MDSGPIIIGARSLMRQAYDAGIEQRECFGIRVSPFYNDRVLIRGQRVDITELLDAFFYCGFDGEPYPEQSGEVKPDALHTTPGAVSSVKRVAAQSAAEGQNEVRTPPEPATGPRQKGIDPPHSGTNPQDEVRSDVTIPAKSH